MIKGYEHQDQVKQQYFSRHLLEWYEVHQRKLPWRESRDPYRIWVSEVMLQQTRVETVIPYYHKFLQLFPTIEALAEAPEDEVLKAWEGLGYYSRVRNLQSAVREVKEQYGSRVPDTKEEISSLKGVGPYTAGAVLSIAYNQPEPAVDGNVMRVLSRFFLIEDDITRSTTRGQMETLAKALIPEGRARDFNQALMELGATVCTPRSPHCLTCPVMVHCAARLEGMETALPNKKKARPPRLENRVVAFVYGSGENNGRFLIRQRPAHGLLAEMWELPHYEMTEISGQDHEEVHHMRHLRECLIDEDGLYIEPLVYLMHTTHEFSHIHWHMNVYRCILGSEADVPLPSHYRWILKSEMSKYAFPNVFLRIIEANDEPLAINIQ